MSREDFAKAIQEAGMHIMEKQDIPAFAQCATSGYKNYPLFNYFCGGSYDEKQALALWQVLLGSLSKDAVCYSDAPDPKGFAIWIPASYQGSSVIEFILAGGLKLPALMGLGVFSRLLRYENHAQRIRMDLTNGKGWYFYNLVTRADCQGMGIGGSLIRPALKLMDSAGDIAYLETHKDTNVPLYERFGFQLLETSITGGKEALQHYAMLREPVR